MNETPKTPDANSNDAVPTEGKKKADLPPDRLSLSPLSKYFDESLLQRGVGIRFKGVEKTNVEEYCISESWIRVPAGKARDRRGNPMTVKLNGPVEAWYYDTLEPSGSEEE